MSWVAYVLTSLVALEHVWFFVLEAFLWTRPLGRRTFGTTPEFAAATAPMMANQGLYNGFLFAGLAWGLSSGRIDITIFFLCCVFVAGVVGGLTVKRAILWIQALPAAAAIGATLLAR